MNLTQELNRVAELLEEADRIKLGLLTQFAADLAAHFQGRATHFQSRGEHAKAHWPQYDDGRHWVAKAAGAHFVLELRDAQNEFLKTPEGHEASISVKYWDRVQKFSIVGTGEICVEVGCDFKSELTFSSAKQTVIGLVEKGMERLHSEARPGPWPWAALVLRAAAA